VIGGAGEVRCRELVLGELEQEVGVWAADDPEPLGYTEPGLRKSLFSPAFPRVICASVPSTVILGG
jgi:hypothetical protein